jgi:hypothetical protein
MKMLRSVMMVLAVSLVMGSSFGLGYAWATWDCMALGAFTPAVKVAATVEASPNCNAQVQASIKASIEGTLEGLIVAFADYPDSTPITVGGVQSVLKGTLAKIKAKSYVEPGPSVKQ